MSAWATRCTVTPANPGITYGFGSFRLRIKGSEALQHLLPEHWHRFRIEAEAADAHVTICVHEGTLPEAEAFPPGWSSRRTGETEQVVYADNGRLVFALSEDTDGEWHLSIGAGAVVSMLLGIRFGMLLALRERCLGLHGVTLLCGDEIVILSAPSGTGKTTLAGLLGKYRDAMVLNGDFAMLTVSDGQVIFEPTPFCGSSGRALNHRVCVKRIVFLGQARENRWVELNVREAMNRFLSNSFVPAWDRELQRTVQDRILEILPLVRVNGYDFRPDKSASDMFFGQNEQTAQSENES